MYTFREKEKHGDLVMKSRIVLKKIRRNGTKGAVLSLNNNPANPTICQKQRSKELAVPKDQGQIIAYARFHPKQAVELGRTYQEILAEDSRHMQK